MKNKYEYLGTYIFFFQLGGYTRTMKMHVITQNSKPLVRISLFWITEKFTCQMHIFFLLKSN